MTVDIPFPFRLETDRLTIRSPSEADASALSEAVAETIDALRPWMPWADHVPTLDETRESCRAAEASFREGSDHRVHIFLRGSPVFVGGAGFHRIDCTVPKCELGYWIRASQARHGYITEAVREMTRFALTTLEMHRVEIRMSPKNSRSRKVPERIGFELEGILRHDGRELDGTLRDTCVFSMLRAEVNRVSSA